MGDSFSSRFVVGERDFLLNGKPFVVRCGEIHFARVPREYWRRRLAMCRAMGLNSVCVYLFWNFHEWTEGEYDWSGQADAAEFCRIAQEEGLWVLLRPGPYSCAEWEMGGLPWWLLQNEGIRLRSTDPLFLNPALRFFEEVGRVLAPLQIDRGGPILMVQVENEYGSFGADPLYMGRLRDALLKCGFTVPLFACNPAGDLRNGYRDDLFQVVNFGAGAAESAFRELRKLQGSGPLMNGEYYPAWFDMWGRRHRTGSTEVVVQDLAYMLENRQSFSVYMAHGGTSFGLWAGADRPFSPDTTSYDYDAPISEAGWPTPKFHAIREVMEKHLDVGKELPAIPESEPAGEIRPFFLRESALLFENLPEGLELESPEPMETFGQSRGATLYRSALPEGPTATLSLGAVHDFAWIFVDCVLVGIMDRRTRSYSLEVPARDRPVRLDVLVYAMGRVNFGEEIYDRKGLHGPVKLASDTLENWQVFPFELDGSELQTLTYGQPGCGPAFWRGGFELAIPRDTFLDMREWGMGVVWVNGQCLGRFWDIGPAQTLYLPAPWLRSGRNEIVVLDFVGPKTPVLRGLPAPILDELHAENDFSSRNRAVGDFTPQDLVSVGSLVNESGWHTIRFETPASGRYLCVESLSAFDGQPVTAIAGLDAMGNLGASVNKEAWKILWASSEEINYAAGHAENAIDGQTSTFWQTEAGPAVAPHPHQLVLDLGASTTLTALRYLPAPVGVAGRVESFRVYLSESPFGLVALS